MDFENSISCVSSPFRGLGIPVVDNDTTSLLNIASTLEEHSFKVTTCELATLALSILRERIDEFSLVMVDVNISEMDCFEFISNVINDEGKKWWKKQRHKGFILMKPISTKKLKNMWQFVYRHKIEASQKF